MICPKCGLQSKEGDRFCHVCGSNLFNTGSNLNSVPQNTPRNENNMPQNSTQNWNSLGYNPNNGYTAPTNTTPNNNHKSKNKNQNAFNGPYIIKSVVNSTHALAWIPVISLVVIISSLLLAWINENYLYTYFIYDLSLISIFLAFIVGLITLITYLIIRKCELYVTKDSVIGRAHFGHEVNLPLYMISSFSTTKFMSGISISTPSGVTRFSLISNYREIGNVLSQQISERQRNTSYAAVAPAPQQNSMDDLLKLKNYLDQGIITQEEFEAKKRQMLGL